MELNTERAAEERQGQIRWLRPEFQAVGMERPQQVELIDTVVKSEQLKITSGEQRKWPVTLKEQAKAVRSSLTTLNEAVTPVEVASLFKGRRTQKRIFRIEEILELLVMLGQAQELEDGRYIAH